MKKFLSLVLALVMTMSLVTISAGAKDFTDADKVNYDEAIAVLSAVKVIDGYTDGSFKPQTQLNRGQAAKIICNLILGPTTAAELHATAAPFSDVPADNIFAGYITYCANKGIIGGYADGTFRPTGTLTGYAFMKMLLGALGYDANIEGYNIPGSWSIQVAKQAIGIGLNKGLKDTFDGTKAVTREEACLYALNTLQADLVEYGSKTNITVGGSAVVIGDSEAKAQKWNNSITKIENIKKDGYIQFAEQYFPKLELEIGNGIYGRPANTWKLKKAEIGTFTSIEPTKVYTESTDEKDVYKDLGKAVAEEYNWTAYVNGEEVKASKPNKNLEEEWAYTGEGTVTEVYVDDDAETVTVCEINYYLGQVSKVKSDDDGEYITVSVISDGGKALDDKTFYVEGYEEDDYVVFTIDTNDDGDKVIGEVCEPEVVTAEVTRVDKDAKTGATYLRTDEGKYTYSEGEADQQAHMVYDLDDLKAGQKHPDLNEDYDLYLDPNGYVVAFAKAEDTVDQYLFVLDSDEHLGTWEAKVLLADGTIAKVEVDSKLKGATNGQKDKITWNNDQSLQHSASSTNIDDVVWKYSVSSKDVYTLTYVKSTPFGYAVENGKPVATPSGEDTYFKLSENKENNVVVSRGGEIHNGKAYITEGVNDIIVDKKTTFVDYQNETAYTGYKEVPDVEKAGGFYIKDDGVAEIVFILDGVIYDANSTYFMLQKNTRESLKYDDDLYWDYSKAYVNGEKQKSLVVAYDALVGGIAGKALTPGVLYKGTKTNDQGYFTEVEALTEGDATTTPKGDYKAWGTVNALGDDAFWITTTAAKQYKFDVDEETVFVYVETDEDGDIKIATGNINDMKKQSDFTTEVGVVKVTNDETARLVYIYANSTLVPETPDKIDDHDVDAAYDGNYTYEISITDFCVPTYLEIADAIKVEMNKKGATDVSVAFDEAGVQAVSFVTKGGTPVTLSKSTGTLNIKAVHEISDLPAYKAGEGDPSVTELFGANVAKALDEGKVKVVTFKLADVAEVPDSGNVTVKTTNPAYKTYFPTLGTTKTQSVSVSDTMVILVEKDSPVTIEILDGSNNPLTVLVID